MQNIKPYICVKCLKTFDRKSNYVRHINRLTSCKSNSNSSKDNVKSYILKKYPKLTEEFVDSMINDDIDYVEKKYNCDYCGKSFKSSSYFKKHVKELCSRHIRFEQHFIIEKLKKIEKFKRDNQELKEKIYFTMKTIPRYYIEEGKVKNVEKNYVNYYEQKNTKPFGFEIIEHISDRFMKRMVMNPEIGIVNLIREIHFNPEIPQNRNIFVKSRKFGFIEVYNKGGWKTFPRKDIYQNIIASKKDIMDEYYERFKEEKVLKEKYYFKYETFSNCLDKYINHLGFNTEYNSNLKKAKQVYERISKMVTLLFLNNQKIEQIFTPEQNINAGNIENIDITEKIKNFLEDKDPDTIDDEDEIDEEEEEEEESDYEEENQIDKLFASKDDDDEEEDEEETIESAASPRIIEISDDLDIPIDNKIEEIVVKKKRRTSSC